MPPKRAPDGAYARARPYVSERKRTAFLEGLAQGLTVVAAAAAVPVSIGHLYKERRRNPDFDQAWILAREQAQCARFDEAEDALFQRGVRGWLKPVWFRGRAVGSELTYDSRLLVKYLEAEDPEKYRANHDAAPDVADVRDAARELLEELREPDTDVIPESESLSEEAGE